MHHLQRKPCTNGGMPDLAEVAAYEQPTARALIEERVAERVCRNTAEQVQEACSFARAERLLGREYHGRFLIELLQNAADAWREREPGGARSRVRIELGEGPCLLVANQGRPFPEKAVIESLGHIGHSTKAHGEAIGHKGIGFKSVLEICLTPELYSGLGAPEPTLAVKFDPRRALALIRSKSPEWDKHLADVKDIHSPESAVPVLRYPMWVNNLPADVHALAADGFDTVIRLPFDPELRPEPNMDVDEWVRVVRGALSEVSDQILLLLGTFDRLEIVDRLGGNHQVIEPQWGAESDLPEDSTRRELVTVTRNGSPTSRWCLYRRTLPDTHDLSGEIAVGLRGAVDGDGLVPAVSGPSAPFHLFFPTKIASGLPFLLHGYFEVNAARTGFYDGSAAQNQAILDELAELVAVAVADAASTDTAPVATLPDLLGECVPPEDARARAFRDRALDLLDEIAWVPIELRPDVPGLAKPTNLLVDQQTDLINRIAQAFPADYIMNRTGLGVPSRRIGVPGHQFLMERRPQGAPDLWESLAVLCRPGQGGPWPKGEEDSRFRVLIDVVAALDLHDEEKTEELLAGLRGDPESCLLPAVAVDGARTLLPVPDASEGVAGSRSRLVMARTRDAGGTALIPPEAMDVAFLPDGLLTSEAEADRAKPLGVRAFTVDNVLDRLRGVAGSATNPEAVLEFLWALLARENRSEFRTLRAAERAIEFDPSAWFWWRPGHGSGGPDADRQRRRRLLTATRVPARDGTWRPTGTLAFGAEWAEWLEAGACGPLTSAVRARASAYRALDAVGPTDAGMIAAPEIVLPHLADDGAADEADEDDLAQRNAERHAFLLTLGVWEVIPVEAFESRETRNRERFPWPGPLHDARMERIAAAGGWRFVHDQWSGSDHQNVWIAEDFRFRWSLTEAASRDSAKTAELLSVGTPLYSRLARVAAFCPGCTSNSVSHRNRYQSRASENYPSILAIQVQTGAWVPAVLDGKATDAPQVASAVWWSGRPPAGAALHQSPLRYVPLCDPEVELAARLRQLAGIAELETADLGRLDRLLETLRNGLDDGGLPVRPDSSSGARQAFIGLHRLAYERLHELAAGDPDALSGLLARVGVLCDLGDRLGYVSPPGDARHDDGRFAAYRRYFVGQVPFATLPRDRGPVATHLGIPTFGVSLERRLSKTSRDVTDELSELLGDRIPDLLAIVVHHSLGTQTLQLGSRDFEDRAKRLRNLRVHQVDDLVIDARVDGTDATATIGEGSDQDLFLDGPKTSQPILFHDLVAEGWKEALRRKLAPHLAALLENPAYSATFALFLLADSDADREEALHELGITGDDVDAVRAAIGAVSHEEKVRQRRWFSAVVATLNGATALEAVDLDYVVEALTGAGMPTDVAGRLAEHGGGQSVRRDVSPEGALWLLAANDVDLREVDKRLRAADAHDGLTIDVAQRRLSKWIRLNRRRAAALIAQIRPPDEAKTLPDSWKAPSELRLVLDPPAAEWLGPVIDSLRVSGFHPRPDALADDAAAELTRMAGLTNAADLEDLAARLYNREERERILRGSAAAWRRELLLLGILARTRHGDSRAAVRAQADSVEELLPIAAASPAALRCALDELFAMHTSLASALSELVTDALSAMPERDSLLSLAREHGVATDHLDVVERALQVPRRDLARKLRGQMTQLESVSLRPELPVGLKGAQQAKPGAAAGRQNVPAINVQPSSDARKRRLGDEGERWALAAVLGEIVALEVPKRRAAIEAIVALLEQSFSGVSVKKALAHAEPACEPELDEEELIDELTELLHVSRHSDGFGFDLLGWLPPVPGSEPIALCLEVKSTRDGTFHLTRGEWERAAGFHEQGKGERYAILVVHRSSGSDPPKRLDLLPDPVHLVKTGQLTRKDDGYELSYQTA